jgi:hypothetical protein
MLFAVYPIFGFMPVEKGGLGLSEAKIGAHMSFRAVTHILTIIPYPYLERRFGFMRIYRFSMIMWPVVVTMFPLLNLVARKNGEDGWVWYGALLVFFMTWAFTGWAWSKHELHSCVLTLITLSFQLRCLSWSTIPVQMPTLSVPSTVSTERL